MPSWLLPDQIEDLLPGQAWQQEQARRALIDVFDRHGYDLVAPPLVEFLESLLTGSGADLDAQTFKTTDPVSGRLLGVRADITPQTARIDAHLLGENGITRLCYAGQVLQVRASAMHRSREPFLLGAELYGHAGVESDIEVVRLLVTALQTLGIAQPLVDIGHVGIFRALLADAPPALADTLLPLLASKQADLLAQHAADLPHAVALARLCQLHGGAEVIERAEAELPKLPAVSEALRRLRAVAAVLTEAGVRVGCDLAELRGFSYHSGLVFSAYAEGASDAIANGGRYDDVGRCFGRARPATGFSIDLKEALRVLPATGPRAVHVANDEQQAAQLRKQGGRVITRLT